MHRCIFHYFFLIEIGLRIRVLHNVFLFSVRSFIQYHGKKSALIFQFFVFIKYYSTSCYFWKLHGLYPFYGTRQ